MEQHIRDRLIWVCFEHGQFPLDISFCRKSDIYLPDASFKLLSVGLRSITLVSVTIGMDHLKTVDHSGPHLWTPMIPCSVLAFVCSYSVISPEQKPLFSSKIIPEDNHRLQFRLEFPMQLLFQQNARGLSEKRKQINEGP